MIEIIGTNDYGFFYGCCATPFKTLTFQGLNLHGFTAPIFGQNGSGTPKAQLNVYGCFIGTTIDGTALPAQRNGYGIDVEYDNAQIGGAQPWQRNLISGNGFGGVVGGYPSATVIIEGNLIGTDVTGTLGIPNPGAGLNLSFGNLPGTRVGCTGTGCTSAASRNVISGNGSSGIHMSVLGNPSGGAQIKGNYIGTDWTGTQPLPNGDPSGNCPSTYCGGIQYQCAGSGPALIVGGFNPGEANLIAYNYGPGLWNNDDSGYSDLCSSFDSQGNAIHNNGPTDIAFRHLWIPNDPGDADTGVNNQQNYPVIQSAHVSGGQLIMTYSVDSATTNSTYPLRIDFYVDIDEGSGEFLGSDTYLQSNAQGAQTATLTLPANALPLIGFVATATTADHYTSEFSPSYVFDRIFADRFEGH